MKQQAPAQQDWQFYIDRGGTFTDIVGRSPQGELHNHKLLSNNPNYSKDAVLLGIEQVLQRVLKENAPDATLTQVKMGTTVATNALLERKGEPVCLVINQGFADALRIGYQNRPDLFALKIELPDLLYQSVIEVGARYNHEGQELQALDIQQVRTQLETAWEQGIRSCAVVLMHSYKYPEHEQQIAKIAQDIGFKQISLSHQVSPVQKLINRGDTTVVDAYLTPVLRAYIDSITPQLDDAELLFMQSHGGLTQADNFQGKDAVLSGPAGGTVAMVETAKQAGFNKIIGFDMGGTSTDVSLYQDEYERTYASEVAGVRIAAPMLKIHTVAAGGGSVLNFDGMRFTVGPESAGAFPGPKSYRNQGPLTVTDINVLLGKIQPDTFPKVFGKQGDQSLDKQAVETAFAALTQQVNQDLQQDFSVEEIAAGFLHIAVEHMANAIKNISIQRGIDVNDFCLSCFGGAGPQHACLVADQLGINQVFIHRLSGVLSAYGMGLADVRELHRQTLEQALSENTLQQLQPHIKQSLAELTQVIEQQGYTEQQIKHNIQYQIKYQGSDTSLPVQADSCQAMEQAFHRDHQQQFGFVDHEAPLIIDSLVLEVIGQTPQQQLGSIAAQQKAAHDPEPMERRQVYFDFGTSKDWYSTPFYEQRQLKMGSQITGPAIILEDNTTVVIEPGWQLSVDQQHNYVVKRQQARTNKVGHGASDEAVNPITLEVFNALYMNIAEQMGAVLQTSAHSVNIKERLDFSCAVFDPQGNLVANAPHMPVHLGSMGESVKSILKQNGSSISAGDSYLLNSPYHGGTHLPDLTVISPVFDKDDSCASSLLFWVASRGHHADVGGITPGSMPAFSQSIEQEGIVFDNFLLVRNGQLNQTELSKTLQNSPYPARNIEQNISDLKAQVAANQKGIKELYRAIDNFGKDTVLSYMKHIQDTAEFSIRQAISQLKSGQCRYPMDNGSVIKVQIEVDHSRQTVAIDFSGTSLQTDNNFNAPLAVTKAAVLYVFRTLVDDDIPLNAGCMRPISLTVPEGCMLNPKYPAAVVAGNVETSQAVTNALYQALGVMAAAQGTMNNLTFGNETYQYYETICGGSGASYKGHGTSAVQTHMTNSRLTDPEVLESRFPVLLNQFSIRTDSAGQGQYHGGEGVIRELQFNTPMEISILANHRQVAPPGLQGGSDAAVGENWLIKANGESQRLDSCAHIKLDGKDRIIIKTPGGAGWGSS